MKKSNVSFIAQNVKNKFKFAKYMDGKCLSS